ncbi:sugar transferase [Rhizorhabdus argentea]|uniref:sugar transferase n=1 Tax=Rhizorhabdus argentea TaxID=1387174 RepID=UPI0030EE36FB
MLAELDADAVERTGFLAGDGSSLIGDRSRAQPTARFDAIMIRLLDIVVSLGLLIFLAPLMLIVASMVYLTNPGPIFFAHRRLGLNGGTFPCFKFRSMVVDAEQRLAHLLATDAAAREEWDRDFKLRCDPRITSIGNFLRKTSLDELPQFVNVLRGEMSLVGPRPIVQGEVERYGRYFSEYSRVKPGITGLWQVSGRNNVHYRRRVALDVSYARNKSLGLDLRILVMTVPAVVLAKGSF